MSSLQYGPLFNNLLVCSDNNRGYSLVWYLCSCSVSRRLVDGWLFNIIISVMYLCPHCEPSLCKVFFRFSILDMRPRNDCFFFSFCFFLNFDFVFIIKTKKQKRRSINQNDSYLSLHIYLWCYFPYNFVMYTTLAYRLMCNYRRNTRLFFITWLLGRNTTGLYLVTHELVSWCKSQWSYW